MRQDKYTCDRCGEVIKEASRDTTIEVVTGRSQDASGNGYEDDVDRVDLCLPCCSKLIRKISKESHGVGQIVLKWSKPNVRL